MVKPKTHRIIRKAHRYLGLFLGLQFLMWTLSGLYFSWTDIDEIHGDHFKQLPPAVTEFSDLIGISELQGIREVNSLELLDIAGEPYYWINASRLYHAHTGQPKAMITEAEALEVAARHMRPDLTVNSVKKIDAAGPHHEYRGRPLPAFEISYTGNENLKAYVSSQNGAFQTVRYRNWRWFDFLWMMHTMDYEGRDNFNSLLLRAFSLLGLITVLSGFTLWYASSPSIRKIFRNGSRK